MNGLFFDFENNDIVIQGDGSFYASNIDSQNCAFIATSQVCRLTVPNVGEQLAVSLLNRKSANVSIIVNEDEQLSFNADYES